MTRQQSPPPEENKEPNHDLGEEPEDHDSSAPSGNQTPSGTQGGPDSTNQEQLELRPKGKENAVVRKGVVTVE
ncbi:hypothetical protein MJO28_012329 [Puccinia striiformis f. sp. tritici]|uniref:Uncharacterized protein n=1 Tax=Puccinia striiformis f. sp. tritici TaxID=168172 RepID=A0ACC0DZW4_9BASI|nr:hypothetical protein MJO28_012329 [Puccinia striiformis f. sp. tritici]